MVRVHKGHLYCGLGPPMALGTHKAGLPRKDFIFAAANSAGDQWCSRPAAFADIQRMLHHLLMKYGGMNATDALVYQPHGFRHFLVVAGVQLRSQGHIVREGVGTLGHWPEASKAIEIYDNEAGVTELSTRAVIMNALRSGWRPAKAGELASPYEPSTVCADDTTESAQLVGPHTVRRDRLSSIQKGPSRKRSSSSTDMGTIVMVLHERRRKMHRTLLGSGRTVCTWWSCGTSEAPQLDAVFCPSPSVLDWTWCKHCRVDG